MHKCIPIRSHWAIMKTTHKSTVTTVKLQELHIFVPCERLWSSIDHKPSFYKWSGNKTVAKTVSTNILTTTKDNSTFSVSSILTFPFPLSVPIFPSSSLSQCLLRFIMQLVLCYAKCLWEKVYMVKKKIVIANGQLFTLWQQNYFDTVPQLSRPDDPSPNWHF